MSYFCIIHRLDKKTSPLIHQVIYTKFEFVFRFLLGSLFIHLFSSCFWHKPKRVINIYLKYSKESILTVNSVSAFRY